MEECPVRPSLSVKPAFRWFVVGAVLAGVFALALVARHGGPSGLIHAAPPFTSPDRLPPGVTAFPEGQAYDGQFFFRMAISPFSTEQELAGVRFDAPSLRAARVGYPLLVWLAAAGKSTAVPWAMIGVNVVAVGVAIGATAVTLGSFGVNRRRSLIVLLLPAANYGISMDLSDPVALAFVAVGLGAYLSRRVPLAVVMMTLAVLVRESTLAIPVVLMAAEMLLAFRRHREEAPWRRRVVTRSALLAIPLAVYALLQVWVSGRYSGTGFEQSGSANVTAPLLTFIRDPGLLVPRDSFAILRLVALGALVSCCAARGGHRRDAEMGKRRCWFQQTGEASPDRRAARRDRWSAPREHAGPGADLPLPELHTGRERARVPGVPRVGGSLRRAEQVEQGDLHRRRRRGGALLVWSVKAATPLPG